MEIRKVRLTIEYDPDWGPITHSQIAQCIADEVEQWKAGDVTVQDLELSETAYTLTMEVVHD